MALLSPIARKRFAAFRRIRRAWWSLLALGAVFAFCLCAELVCPCDPKDVVDPAELEKYRAPVVEETYEIRTARFSVDAATGGMFDFEGPEDVRAAAAAEKGWRDGAEWSGYAVRATRREGFTRVFLDPLDPPKATARVLPAPEISFPFRPCREHPFGVDAGGRDVYARVVHGMRIALAFGFVLALSGMLVGLVAGAVEGYFGGVVDIVGQRLTEIWSAVPFLYVVIFVGSTLGNGFGVLLVCYAAFNWITVSYYMRAEFLRLRVRAFVDVARSQGLGASRIIFAHILPNALTPLVTLFPFLLMGAIGSLAALDFLGFGLPPMTPSCGELMQEAQQFRWAWWLVLFPGAALFAVMLLAVLVGEGLRDAFDPHQRSRLE
ncbi:MAG: ABC transporter permease subunit [Kiritimatiellae bacterium]|nr:ABC transporter permease subunit [Kiritimatiellia bacterium]